MHLVGVDIPEEAPILSIRLQAPLAIVASVLFAAGLMAAGSAHAQIAAEPRSVSLEVTLENRTWFPLPADAMKSAARDAALSEISKGGWLSVVPAARREGAGSLVMAVSLVGKAETARTTLTLDLPAVATVVATASISVRELDRQGFYRAFEHVGRTAAERLNARLLARTESPPAAIAEDDDRNWKAVYDEGQLRKYAHDYADARQRFEQVAAAEGSGTARLREMASDELRFGLPLFEAQHTMLSLGEGGGRPGSFDHYDRKISRAEQLMRQIQAENSRDLGRVLAAQRFLDELSVTRRGIRNSLRSSALVGAAELRMILTEQYYTTGRCPEPPDVRKWMDGMPYSYSGSEGGRIAIVHDSTGAEIDLICENGIRIEMR